jgi:hypothetical protein
MQKIGFGTKGIWHMPACQDNNIKARDIKCTVLKDDGTLDLLLDEPIKKGWRGITNQIVTVFHSDFTQTDQEWCPTCHADLPPNHFLRV